MTDRPYPDCLGAVCSHPDADCPYEDQCREEWENVRAHPDYDERVEARLHQWEEYYDLVGVPQASPTLDRILAEQQITSEIRKEQRARSQTE